MNAGTDTVIDTKSRGATAPNDWNEKLGLLDIYSLHVTNHAHPPHQVITTPVSHVRHETWPLCQPCANPPAMMTVRALCVVLVAVGVVGMASADLATTTSDPSAPQQIHIAFRGAVRGMLMRFSSAWRGCVLPCVYVRVYHGYVVDVLCDGGACVPATALLCPLLTWIYSCCWCATFQNYDMVVSWLTGVQTSTSTVKYGTSSGVYTHTVNGSLATSYYKDNFVHHVVLEGLTASTTYYYVCGDAAVRSSCRGYT